MQLEERWKNAMEYRCFGETYIVRLDPDEEILTKLAVLAEKEQIRLAEVSGLGALKELRVCVFDTAEKVFYDSSYTEALELLSLSGTITEKEGKPYLHIHAAAGDGTGRAVGGHLKEAIVSATAEIVVHVINGSVGRSFHDKIGLNLLDFS